ncbi:hypothetical protein [Prevotella sp.]|uniref:hypothetical protein n=1 Tax=Prevotella sp. TaxID=59823 RepID=UPI00307A3111
MKSRLIQRLTSFLDQRSHNWQQRLCLITFLMLSLSVLVLGVPMHIVGLIGRCDTILYTISAMSWAATLACYTDYVPYAAYEADCGDIIVRNIDTVGRKCPYSIRGNGASGWV